MGKTVTEPFLINPVAVKAKKVKAHKKATRKVTAVSKVKKHDIRPRLKKVGPKTLKRGAKSPYKDYNINPLGEEVVIVGLNPKKAHKKKHHKKHKAASHKTTSHKRHNPINPVKRHQKKVHHRRHGRNPATSSAMSLDVMKPQTLLMPIGIAIAGSLAAKKLPALLKLTGMLKYGAMVAIGVGGAFGLKKPLGATNAALFGISALTTAVTTALSEKIGGVFADDFELGDDDELPYYGDMSSNAALSDDDEELGAFPQLEGYAADDYESEEYGAFPESY